MKILLAIALIIVSQHSIAQERKPLSLTLKDKSLENGKMALLVERNLNIPPQISTIGEAVNFVLNGTGYRLADISIRSDTDALLMNRAVARSQRNFLTVPVIDILDTLSGVGFVPVIDPVNKLVAFDLSNSFRSLEQ